MLTGYQPSGSGTGEAPHRAASPIEEAAQLDGKRIAWRFKGGQSVKDLTFRIGTAQHETGTPLVAITGPPGQGYSIWLVLASELDYYVLGEEA